MGLPIEPVTVIAGGTVRVDLSQYALNNRIVGVRLTNESNIAVKVSGITAGTGEWQPAYTEYLWRALPDVPLGNRLTLQGESISSSSDPPSAVMLITLYFSGDNDLPSGAWPMSLNRLSNVGNPVSGTFDTLINDGHAPGTVIIEATDTSGVGSDLTVTNSGDITTNGSATLAGSVTAVEVFAKQNLAGGNRTYFVAWAPDGHFWTIQQATDFSFRIVDVSTGAAYIFGAALGMPGPIFTIGGQTTVGGFGVPVIVAQALATTVTATSDQSILSFTPPAPGLYQIHLSAYVSQAGPCTVTAFVKYFSGNDATNNPGQFFQAGTTNLNGAALVKGEWGTTVITIYAGTGGNIVVHYQDATGSPNDKVSAMIVRLS